MTLTQLFTNIANAIRAKTGSSETIRPTDFANQIDGIPTGIIPTGEIAITQNGTVDVSNYASAHVNVSGEYNTKIITKFTTNLYTVGGAIEKIPDIDTSDCSSLRSAFAGCTNLVTIPQLNTNKCRNMQNMFLGCKTITTIPQFNTSIVTTMSEMFSGCESLTTIPLLNTSSVSNMNNMFNKCTNLVTIPQLNTNKVTGMGTMFTNCLNLSNESLNNILAMCTNAVKITSNKTLKYIGLSQTQAETCQTLSNWNDFVAAGWTSGY